MNTKVFGLMVYAVTNIN